VWAWVLTIVLLALLTVALLPRIKTAVSEAKVGQIIHSGRQEPTVRVASVYFPLYDESKQFWQLHPFSVPLEGDSLRHGLIETLLDGPPASALAQGAITFIPADTLLLGLTVSVGVAFVDLDHHFLASHPLDLQNEGRIAQITKTLLTQSSIKEVIILVEGQILEQ